MGVYLVPSENLVSECFIFACSFHLHAGTANKGKRDRQLNDHGHEVCFKINQENQFYFVTTIKNSPSALTAVNIKLQLEPTHRSHHLQREPASVYSAS